MSIIDVDAQLLYNLANQIYKSGTELLNYNTYNSNEKIDEKPQTIDYQYQSNQNQRPNYPQYQQPSTVCSEYFSYENGYGVVSGRLTIPVWNKQSSVIKAVFTVGTRISNVRSSLIDLLKSVVIFQILK